MPVASYLLDRWEAWKAGGTICAEMETAILFTLSSIYRKRAGSILLIAINQEGPDPEAFTLNQEPVIRTAIEAIKLLIEADKK